METEASDRRKGRFVKVGENLYRYTSSKKYYAVFRKEGRLVWKSLKTADKEMAQRLLRDILDAGPAPSREIEKTSLEGMLQIYEQWIKQFKPKTQATRQSILKIFKETWDHGFKMPVRSVRSAHIDMWLAKHRSRLRAVTYNEYIRFLRQLFELAVSHGVLFKSPAAELKQLRPEDPIRNTPTWQQFQALVANIRGQEFSAEAQDTGDVVEFMGLAGVGTAECANLKGEHIDFENKRITLFRQKTETDYKIPIFPQLAPFLEKLNEKGAIKFGQPVFKIRDPKRALIAACKRLKYPNFSPRSLRRCFITRCIELGIDFKTVAAWQGHRDGGVLIARVYSHLRSEHSDSMARKLRA